MNRMFHLTDAQRRQLRAQLCSTSDVDVYRRTLALLEVDEGRSPSKVSRALGVSCSSVYNWLSTFQRVPHADALADHRKHGRPSLWTDSLENVFREALRLTPDACGYPAAHWTVPLLQAHLHRHGGRPVSDPTIRRKLRQSGYVWDGFGYVLTGGREPEKKLLDSAALQTSSFSCHGAKQG